MIALLKVVPLWAWIALAAIIGIGVQTYRLQAERSEYAEYVAQIQTQKAEAEQKAREAEQAHQTAVDKVTKDAAKQKAADDAHAAQLVVNGNSLREQTRKLLADRAALSARLAARGKSIDDLTDLLAQLRQQLDDFAQPAAIGLDEYRRAAMACEQSYDAVRGAK